MPNSRLSLVRDSRSSRRREIRRFRKISRRLLALAFVLGCNWLAPQPAYAGAWAELLPYRGSIMAIIYVLAGAFVLVSIWEIAMFFYVRRAEAEEQREMQRQRQKSALNKTSDPSRSSDNSAPGGIINDSVDSFQALLNQASSSDGVAKMNAPMDMSHKREQEQLSTSRETYRPSGIPGLDKEQMRRNTVPAEPIGFNGAATLPIGTNVGMHNSSKPSYNSAPNQGEESNPFRNFAKLGDEEMRKASPSGAPKFAGAPPLPGTSKAAGSSNVPSPGAPKFAGAPPLPGTSKAAGSSNIPSPGAPKFAGAPPLPETSKVTGSSNVPSPGAPKFAGAPPLPGTSKVAGNSTIPSNHKLSGISSSNPFSSGASRQHSVATSNGVASVSNSNGKMAPSNSIGMENNGHTVTGNSNSSNSFSGSSTITVQTRANSIPTGGSKSSGSNSGDDPWKKLLDQSSPRSGHSLGPSASASRSVQLKTSEDSGGIKFKSPSLGHNVSPMNTSGASSAPKPSSKEDDPWKALLGTAHSKSGSSSSSTSTPPGHGGMSLGLKKDSSR